MMKSHLLHHQEPYARDEQSNRCLTRHDRWDDLSCATWVGTLGELDRFAFGSSEIRGEIKKEGLRQSFAVACRVPVLADVGQEGAHGRART